MRVCPVRFVPVDPDELASGRNAGGFLWLQEREYFRRIYVITGLGYKTGFFDKGELYD